MIQKEMSTLLFVTGASRGLGRAISLQFCETLAKLRRKSPTHTTPLLRVVLISRDEDKLIETENEMKKKYSSQSSSSSSSSSIISVRREIVNLSNLDTLESTVDPILKDEIKHFYLSFKNKKKKESVSTSQYYCPKNNNNDYINDIIHHRAILINCAGSTGYIGPFSTLKDIQEATNLNFISKTWLSTQFARHFLFTMDGDVEEERNENKKENRKVITECTIVNITSMCAVKATPTMGLYCATSAARDIYHKVLAIDSSSNSSNDRRVRILNYAPGSCNTNMQARLRDQEPLLDKSVQAYCRSLLLDNDVNRAGLVECEDTAKELVDRVLNIDGKTFTNGERIEFTDMSSYKY